MAHNKPIIPTSTRCARFVGILGRYMPMKKAFFIASILASSCTMASEPKYCGKDVENLFAMLIIQDKLGKSTAVEPGDDYKHKQNNNLCVIKGSLSKDGKWTVHKHSNGEIVVFQLTNSRSGSESYYGPFGI